MKLSSILTTTVGRSAKTGRLRIALTATGVSKVSEINWQKLRQALTVVTSEERDGALLMLASCVLGTDDNMRLCFATELAPGWISSQLGEWRKGYVLIGGAIDRKVALKRFPELAATFAAIDAGEFNVAAKAVAPVIVNKPVAVASVAEWVPVKQEPERELAMSETCTRAPGCPKPAKHVGYCPGGKIQRAKAAPIKAAALSVAPTVTQKPQAVEVVRATSAATTEPVAEPATIKGRVIIRFEPDDKSMPDFQTSWPKELSMADWHSVIDQFDYAGTASA
jgi:hypothetical protein